MWYILGLILVILLVLIAWRWTSVGRGARQRDERILKLIEPIGQKLEAGKSVTPDEIYDLAKRPEVRFMLFSSLKAMDHSKLIPSEYSSQINQAESALAYWLMHPNEFQNPPEKIEHIEELTHPLNNEDAKFHVFRFLMPDDHWAAKDGWQLGLVGPINENLEPYSHLPGAFSRTSDSEGSVDPKELVKWYVDMIKKKGMVA